MNEQKAAELLKKAIILEKQGQAFYRSVSKTTAIDSLKKLFDRMAEEEKIHENTLRTQLDYLINKGEFDTDLLKNDPGEFAKIVFSADIIKSIKGADYEASAISAAMGLEIRSSEFYSERAEATDDATEKELFSSLADWESSHLKVLSDLNRRLLEQALREDVY
ncbi:MAG: ferritin family protein [Desulfobacterales bacterium]|nr:ferritin family protein [Deltaproteobacteria bacterium]NNK97171.1 ferritin family protein [Desulfobacterales bacterium]